MKKKTILKTRKSYSSNTNNNKASMADNEIIIKMRQTTTKNAPNPQRKKCHPNTEEGIGIQLNSTENFRLTARTLHLKRIPHKRPKAREFYRSDLERSV